MSTRPLQRRSVLDRAPGSGVPNMTPMVDVTLVILIFFMASATIAGPEWFLRAGLPAPTPPVSSLNLPSPVLRVEVFTRDGATRVRGLGPERTLADAVAAVEAMDPAVSAGLVVDLEPADDAPYADLVRLHAALIDAAAEVRLR